MICRKASRTQIEQFRKRIYSVSEIDIAWFSGWLCADGCIKKDKDRFIPRIRFVICDKDPLERFSLLFGNSVGGPQPPSGLGKLPRFEWGIAGWKAVFILQRCLPYLSERYLKRAHAALDNFKVSTSLPLRCYILGKMTHIPYYNFPAFDEARDSLKRFGFDVISPADEDRKAGLNPFELPENFDWGSVPKGINLAHVIRKDINIVLTVDCYSALDGWETSRGARAEKALADWRGIPRIDWRTGKLYGP